MYAALSHGARIVDGGVEGGCNRSSVLASLRFLGVCSTRYLSTVSPCFGVRFPLRVRHERAGGSDGRRECLVGGRFHAVVPQRAQVIGGTKGS